MALFKSYPYLKLFISGLPNISQKYFQKSSLNMFSWSSSTPLIKTVTMYQSISHVSKISGLSIQDDVERKISNVTSQDGVVCVHWEDNGSVSYLTTWLRDNCTCHKCFHPASEHRLQLFADLDLNMVPKTTTIDGNALVIHWEDGHLSTFPSQWLQERSLAQPKQIPKKSLWSAAFLHQIPQFDYRQLAEDDTHLLSCLQSMEQFGITLIKGVPCQIDSLQSLSKKVAFLKETHYGDNFEVVNKSDPNNLAYTSADLGLHLDLPYYHYTPGTQLLHCIKQHQGEGGENQFVDGFSVAEKIRDLYPEDWNILTTVPVQFLDRGVTDYGERKGDKFHKIVSKPTINLGRDGRVTQVCFNNTARDSNIVGDLETTRSLYRSLKRFNDLANSPELMVQLKMEEGDLMWVDNLRVLHGRNGFGVREGQGGGRHLQGAYIDWDEIYSRINVLKEQLG